MKLLLDTHILIWSQGEPEKLCPTVVAALADFDNEFWISPLSAWELDSLLGKRKLSLQWPAREWLQRLHAVWPLLEAPLTIDIVLTAGEMRFEHRDPVDRILAATAKVEGFTLVTADTRLRERTDIAVLANV